MFSHQADVVNCRVFERRRKGRGTGPLIHLVMAILMAPSAVLAQSRPGCTQQPIDRRSLCYAFLQNGDIWSVCQGRRERIHFDRKLLDFAVSTDGTYLAVQESLEQSWIGSTRQLLVSLNPPLKEKIRTGNYPDSLYATCGTIVSFDYPNRHAFDLINSQSMDTPPYKFFRCSSNRQVIAGWTEQDETEGKNRLRVTWSNEITLRVSRSGKPSEFLIYNPDVFDVSPNGSYLAYFTVPKQGPGPKLCVAGPTGDASCVLHYGDAVSVSDAGDVFFWAGELGVLYWRSGLKRPLLLEKDKMNPRPQWITPQVAAALHRWNTRDSAGHSSP